MEGWTSGLYTMYRQYSCGVLWQRWQYFGFRNNGESSRSRSYGMTRTSWQCIPSSLRLFFPRWTMLQVLTCLAVPRAVRPNQATERTRRIPCTTKQPQPHAQLSFTNLYVWRTKSSLTPVTNLCSHSRRPTPGYQHIPFTAVPQFTGIITINFFF
jgi:hypothetical protein